ncbi:hypothetical protein BgiMline_007166 [Biomphalaria glabrata]|nr:transcription termination factor 1 [Biomphalaria glabrata]
MAAPLSIHDFDVLEPTYCRLQHNFTENDKLKSLIRDISAFIPSQRQHEKILSDFDILNILLYRRGGQLRRLKCFQLLKRVQTCLKRFHKFEKLYQLLLALNKDLKSADAGYESGSKNVYLPSRQNWSYVLYIQSVYVQLLKTTGTYCVLAFTDLSQLLVFGWFVPTVIVFMGIIARIWLLCQTLTEKVVSSYNKIYLCREMFEPSASGWSEPLLAPLLCSTTKVQPKLVEQLTEASQQVNEIDREMERGETTRGDVMSHVQEEDIGEPVAVKRKSKSQERPNKRLKLDEQKLKKKFPQTNREICVPGVKMQSVEATESVVVKTTKDKNSLKKKKKKKKCVEKESDLDAMERRSAENDLKSLTKRKKKKKKKLPKLS